MFSKNLIIFFPVNTFQTAKPDATESKALGDESEDWKIKFKTK